MEYALIKEGKVSSVIVADQEFVQSISDQYDLAVEVTDHNVGIGWEFTAEGFVPPPVVSKPLINRVSMRQFKLALLKEGLLSKIPSIISRLESPTKEEFEIEWQYSTAVLKDGFLVKTVQDNLKISEEDISALFELADQL